MELRNGNLLVTLAPGLQAFPEELIRQRRTYDGQTEYLIRWSLVTVNQSSGGVTHEVGGTLGGASSSALVESKAENVLMWMSMEDVLANCPALLGKRKLDSQRPLQDEHQQLPADAELSDMKQDVRNLVRRARKQMEKKNDFSINIMHTIHVLSAYASIGALVSVFKEAGALDLLMELLYNQETLARRSAGRMLRALASHDAGSRAYVLLSLSQQDGIEQHMDFDNRYTLLELFAETTSTEEHGVNFEGIHLPQIPGKLLFSLVKRYLCVTSLMDKLSSAEEEPVCSPSPSAQQAELQQLQREFDFTMAMANLISELVRVLGWDRNRRPEAEQPPQQRSIFQRCRKAPPTITASVITTSSASPKKKTSGFKTRSDFASRAAYVEYVQDNLKGGMTVRMLEDYEEVRAGDQGEYRYSNDGSPPVQVYWSSLSRTYWVHWDMLEIVSSSKQAEKEEKTSLSSALRLCEVSQVFKPPGGLYSLPYLFEDERVEPVVLSRADWWELLFFIRKLETYQQQEVKELLHKNLPEQDVSDCSLIGCSVPGGVAYRLLCYLKQKLPSACVNELLCSHTYKMYYLRGRAIVEEAKPFGANHRAAPGLLCKKAKTEEEGMEEDIHDQTDDETEEENHNKHKDVECEGDFLSEDLSRFPGDMEDRIKAFNSLRVQGRRSLLEKLGEVVDVLRSGASSEQQLPAVLFLSRLLQDKTSQDRNTRIASAHGLRDRVLKLLVELLTSTPDVVVATLRVTYLLMLRYDWRVSFATEGGVKAVLSCMRQFSSDASVQQMALATLKVVTGAGKHDLGGGSSSDMAALSESNVQMMLEIFASIGSASSDGCRGLLGTIPAAIDLLLQGRGSVRNGLLVVMALVSNHQSLAQQLVSCDVISVLRKCVKLSSSESMLAIIALSHISRVHKDAQDLDLQHSELQMLVVSLKEVTANKDVIHTLEQLLCDDNTHLEDCTLVTHNKETFQDLLRLMEQHRTDRAVQLSILRILHRFLDHYEDDELPWHESIEPILASVVAFITDKEVVQLLLRFLYRLASLNKDCAVVMSRLGAKEVLIKVQDKHSSMLLLSELRDSVNDCDKYANLYKKMTTSVLAGCIQMVLGQIEEHRRSHQPINIPFFDVFLRNLCQGSSVELKEDKCWEKVEVSSNHHRANKLTDRNPKTYWESNGCTGSHFINLHMHKGVVIRQLAVLVSSEDSSYMPARILVLGGDDATNINTELNTVNVTPSSSRVVLLENMTRFWSIIQIRIKRCQQGGIDTRVHGFEVLGPKPTFWPVFKEQLCCRTYLFYSTKAHTWSQEVLQDHNQLFTLFNKLNNALKHEQMFADRFLSDVEAAEALGQTCWEALILPIVHNITHTESGAVSPLSWLLSEYLKNAESSRRCRGRAAVFNSRVRRLTHLLVHVDTSRECGVELRAPPRSSGLNGSKDQKNAKDGKIKESSSSSSSSSSSGARAKEKCSSIADIALCWKEVVTGQVKTFLGVSSAQVDFVQLYVQLYERLKQSTEELFGQHVSMVVALRQGFSSALLQLSVCSATHVSERFAHYIDHMIQSSRAGSDGSTLQRLQMFLEPTLFLSGLELANSFEHFYRMYLADRLLSEGNQWLETSVVENISSCFPSHFPQQMLKNFRESEELQQDFHLYRLQQLDQHLHYHQDQDQGMDCSQEDEDQEEVHVLVLSPRCWAVSSLCFLEEPHKHLPDGLSSYLDQFTSFYCHGQRMCDVVVKPRRLQWTWLGHAELMFGSWTLKVSTLQMFILLKLNHTKEVSVKELLQQSGLSSEFLLHALQPLTATGGPITCSTPDHMTQGVLWVNQQVVAQSAAGPALTVRLLPDQTYLKEDEDVSGLLERKRNYIYCVIVNMMKQHKQLHIDNLLYKVMESCQKAEGVALSCSSSDVLSCILHIISRGCICRNEDNPHILEFVPDETTSPHKGLAQLCFSNSVPPGQFADGVVMSSARTMTQEEVSELMQNTVKQVSGTLGLDLDWTQHLLIHCQWNVDLLVQSYTDDPHTLITAAGLQCEPQLSPAHTCPVCLSPRTDTETVQSLSCMHYCCKACWQEYLTLRIEQNLMSCNCPITDCQAQPTSHFFLSVLEDRDTVAKYQSALLRGFVQSCSNLAWCTNPQGCDRILCQNGPGTSGTCSQCCWESCFSCSFPQGHCPASCSLMSQWMDDGGFYEGMSLEAQSKHLAKLISKRCPNCTAQIEKNEGCLHMKCAKCNHGFCWRCLKPWKPSHKDYYNCSAMVSKAARQDKKFQDYNERCTFHHQAKDFAIALENRVGSINEALQMKSLTFVIDACKALAQARKVLAYACVYCYYNQETEKMDVMEQQTEVLELHTNALQILLEVTLLQCTDLASCVRLLKPEHLKTGLELIRRIQERLQGILLHSTQDFRVGCQTKTDQEPESPHSSNTHLDPTGSKPDQAVDSGDNNNNNNQEGGDEAEDDGDDEYDDEYVPEWHEDYDEDDIEDDDFFSDDYESENPEYDFNPFD
ncbi:cullin-9 isoform X2 [Gouania willdenowi]|uniref:cullin-9 isoform X2 n=1 Tax=Gouania willdenowi TaxID=441366 RepID=UPI001056DBCC|nr:cullin-9 isoform X2 [Gouania willdenowi]